MACTCFVSFFFAKQANYKILGVEVVNLLH